MALPIAGFVIRALGGTIARVAGSAALKLGLLLGSASGSGPIRIEVRGLDKAIEKAERVHAAMLDMSVPYKQGSIFLDQWVQQNFRTQGGKVGGWQPLAAGGRWKKGRFDANAKILQDTGRLRASFIPWATKANAGIGSELPYSKAHEKGLRGLPVRRMLPKRAEVIAPLREIMDAHVKRSLKK